jgi:hypothetical protein
MISIDSAVFSFEFEFPLIDPMTGIVFSKFAFLATSICKCLAMLPYLGSNPIHHALVRNTSSQACSTNLGLPNS